MENTRAMSKKSKKWLKIIIFSAISIFLISMFFNKYFWDSTIMSIRMKLFQKRIERQEQKYINDKYGGKTPEETYQMFLDALKKKDIELASKYFVLEKQEEYKNLLKDVDKRGKWDIMMEDLTRLNTANWEKVAVDYVNLELFSKDNILAEQITFVLPNNILPPNNPISDIWKISSF